ncbi:hypothetical protein BGZ96_010272 [Linnemannia gamsii]|uniref:C2H2-type domain-containing protein n=1 Tax=Linnemannia gamsii TaxID=64522 RepID=A0ABQ7JUU0_9FUNG|nr:hypothetical protein BGZ96_010272 [Linnemannia gamsii]
MTRRRSQALLSQNVFLAVSKRSSAPSPVVTKPKPLPFARLTTSRALLTATTGRGARSSIITSPSSPLNPSGISGSVITPSPRTSSSSSSSSSVYTPLICEICKKEYANNSTLRRHAKIHAYANASIATRKICNPPRLSSTPVTSGAMGANSVMLSSTHGSGGAPGLNTGVSSNMSSTLAAVNTHLLSSFWPYRDAPSPGTIMIANASVPLIGDATPTPTPDQLLLHQSSAVDSAVSGLMPGYNPGYDPTIRKPECAGCNKPFARRDTVILHIKNQKRKWDLLCAMLPALAVSTSTPATTASNADYGGDVSDDGDDGDEDDEETKNNDRRTSSVSKGTGWKAGSTAAQRRIVHQKKAHPFRVAEKLWQSTLQMKKIHFGAYKKPPSTSTVTAVNMATTTTAKRSSVTEAAGPKSRPLSFGNESGADVGEFDEEMHVDNDHQSQLQHQRHQTQGDVDVEMMNAYMANNIHDVNNNNKLNELQRENEDGWPSQEALELMDNQTKIQWMVRMAVVPPCWSERKVRIFGLHGEVEENVLQDG